MRHVAGGARKIRDLGTKGLRDRKMQDAVQDEVKVVSNGSPPVEGWGWVFGLNNYQFTIIN